MTTPDSVPWQLRLTAAELETDFIRPYVGNGYLGCRFDRLVIAPRDADPLLTLTAELYDGGRQLVLPAWNQVDLAVDGVPYVWERGTHRLTHTLDLATGEVSVDDAWEYRPGYIARVRIALLVPRGARTASCLDLAVEAAGAELRLEAGLDARAAAATLPDCDFEADGIRLTGVYRTAVDRREVRQELQAVTSSGVRFDIAGRVGSLIVAGRDCLTVELRHRVRLDGAADDGFPTRDRAELRCVNAVEWAGLWSAALQRPDLSPDRRLTLRVQQFYLLCSLNAEPTVLGPLGLSAPGWGGAQFWDVDFWLFRALLPRWPELARARLCYRWETRGEAEAYAREKGLDGWQFPWKSDDRGRSMVRAEYEEEIHLSAWTALAAVEHFRVTGDLDFFRDRGEPLLRQVAAMFYSRGQFEDDGRFHFRNVLGPDEAVHEIHHRYCDDNFLTNYAVARLFRAVAELAPRVGRACPPEWLRAAERIYLPAAGSDGVIPEYEGYAGDPIKQADLILAFYPLGCDPGRDAILANLDYYHGRTMDYGPFMTTSIEALLLIRCGRPEEGRERLFASLAEFCRGPHRVLCESRNNTNAVFLTGIGGFLQALEFGERRENRAF